MDEDTLAKEWGRLRYWLVKTGQMKDDKRPVFVEHENENEHGHES